MLNVPLKTGNRQFLGLQEKKYKTKVNINFRSQSLG